MTSSESIIRGEMTNEYKKDKMKGQTQSIHPTDKQAKESEAKTDYTKKSESSEHDYEVVMPPSKELHGNERN
jgi:hypothetical protein